MPGVCVKEVEPPHADQLLEDPVRVLEAQGCVGETMAGIRPGRLHSVGEDVALEDDEQFAAAPTCEDGADQVCKAPGHEQVVKSKVAGYEEMLLVRGIHAGNVQGSSPDQQQPKEDTEKQLEDQAQKCVDTIMELMAAGTEPTRQHFIDAGVVLDVDEQLAAAQTVTAKAGRRRAGVGVGERGRVGLAVTAQPLLWHSAGVSQRTSRQAQQQQQWGIGFRHLPRFLGPNLLYLGLPDPVAHFLGRCWANVCVSGV